MDPGSRGKRLWVDFPKRVSGDGLRGSLQTFSNRVSPIERLTVRIDVEPFTANGAHVYLMVSTANTPMSFVWLSINITTVRLWKS